MLRKRRAYEALQAQFDNGYAHLGIAEYNNVAYRAYRIAEGWYLFLGANLEVYTSFTKRIDSNSERLGEQDKTRLIKAGREVQAAIERKGAYNGA